MGHASEVRLLALLGLRLTGFADPARIATAAGLPSEQVDGQLDDLATGRLARYRDNRSLGVASGWSLTPAGRAELDELLRLELDDAGCRDAVEDAYRRFLALNRPLLDAVTAWQVRDGQVNDHADPAYDEAILDELGRINAMIEPVLADVAACLDRFGRYQGRLAAALERASRGERAFVDAPLADSFHSVWFELHEDLLVTLGLERASETPAVPT
jgi:hypothetical protein